MTTRTKNQELSTLVGRALRRAARTARKTAVAHGTPIYVSKNGKIVALSPKPIPRLK